MRALATLTAIVSIGSVAIWAAQAQPAFPELPLAVALAEENGARVVGDAWLARQVEVANEVYGPHGIRYRVVEQRTIAARYARLETRADRHALGAEMRPRVINAFVVASMRDVDDPTLHRMGVHWRPRLRGVPRGAHFVIITAAAMPSTLAHELGHFFGNGHSSTPGNLMSYDGRDRPPFLDPAQVRRIHTSARRFLRTRELVPTS